MNTPKPATPLDPAVLKEIEKGKRPLPVGSGEGLYARMETDTEFATRIALMQAEASLRQAADKLAAQEFFHDGLSADLLECKDKAHAYMECWQDAVAELRALAAAQERKFGPSYCSTCGCDFSPFCNYRGCPNDQ